MMNHFKAVMLWTLPLVAVGFAGFQINAVQAPEAATASSGPAASSSAASRYVEDLAGVVLGAATVSQRVANTQRINAALSQGIILRLRAGSRIEIASSLIVPSGSGIIGDPGGTKPEIFMPAGQFTNRDETADGGRYARNAVAISFSGTTNRPGAPTDGVRLANFRVVSDPAMGRRLRAIVGQNVTNCTISNVEVSGIPSGMGIALASARNCSLSDIYVHDFSDTSAWDFQPQSTGIEIDNDLISGVPSSGVRIERFRVDDITVGGPSLARWGYQTDGINIVNYRSRVDIADGRISNVGEGIDTFGSDGTISNVEINEAYMFGLKLIHGASRNTMRNISITNAGIAGVSINGSNESVPDTADNLITGLRIKNLDPHLVWRENSSTGVSIAGNKSLHLPRNNRVIGAHIDLGPNGKYGWVDGSTGSGNLGTDIVVVPGSSLDRTVLIQRGGGSVVLRDGQRF